MTAIIHLHGAERLNTRLTALSKSMRPAQFKRAIRPAANLHRKTAKSALRRVIRTNKRNYPATHPNRVRGTGNLLAGIKVIPRRRTLQVLSSAPHSYLVEFGHASRDGSKTPGYPFFFKVLRGIRERQLQLIAARARDIIAKAANR